MTCSPQFKDFIILEIISPIEKYHLFKCLANRGDKSDLKVTMESLKHGIINDIGTKAKCRHLKKLNCKRDSAAGVCQSL